MNVPLIVSILFAVGIFLIFLGLDLVVSGRTIPLDKRVDIYKPSTPTLPTPVAKTARAPLVRFTPESFQRQLAADLARADLPVTASEFFTATIIITLLGFIIGLAIFSENLFVALLLGIAGFVTPRVYLHYLQGKHLEAFANGLPGTLVLLANSLRSGYGWGQAIETVANEAAAPISTEFGRVNREIALGLSSEEALNNLLRRNPSLDLELVIMAINVNRQVGGNLSEILDQIASTIRDRVRLEEEIRTLTAQQRFTASVLTFLPPIVGVVIYIVNSGYVALLWETSCGIGMLIGGAILLVLGYAIMQRILVVKF